MSDWYESIEDIDVPIQNEDIITFDGISHDREDVSLVYPRTGQV